MDLTDKNAHLVGELGLYTVIDTEDGHTTLYSKYFDENCHSLKGAYEETCYNYVQGCNVLETAQIHNNCHILEVGFGIGLGYKCTTDSFCQELSEDELIKLKITFISLEIDPFLIEYAKMNTTIFSEYFPTFHELKEYQMPVRHLKAKKDNKELIILIGDARKSLPLFSKKLNYKFDAIYQDPFSPKKNPILWTKQWFELLKNYSHAETKLSTYSSSSSVRKTLVHSGWIISNHKGFKSKKTCTHATLEGEICSNLLKGLQSEKIKVLIDN
ncbi:MAG: hypothetical protein HN576_10315 [Bacteriovoracaceae bacterium]|jgi:tRNA U34 5-methylaminomethyl-2-thiouridine-forming methyltransferase MnmC|nr:hypothetical protein [Bacteriovoracaceae bacterium]